MKRFVRVCSGYVALATGVALAPVTTAMAVTSQSAVSTAHWTSQHVTISAPRHVNLKQMGSASGGQQSHGHVAPFRHVSPSRAATAQRAGSFSSGVQRASVATLPAPRAGVSPTVAFPMMSYDQQVSMLGTNQEDWPPDTQVAAGPNDLVEATNDSLSVWSKSGALLSTDDLNLLFGIDTSQQLFTDPRVLYDAASGHWFLSGWSFSFSTSNNSQTFIAVSSGTDPTAGWITYRLENQTATLTDQPMIGVCDDKVVMAWNKFTGTGSALSYGGAQALVMLKSALTTGATSVPDQLFTTTDEFRLVPAQSLTATTTCYMAVNNAAADILGSTVDPKLGVIAVTGTPPSSPLPTETDLPVAATDSAPAPQQPGGAVEAATSNDDRFLSAVWQNGQLWTSATDACRPSGDTTVRNCMRLDEVDTSTMTVGEDFDLGTPGLDDYYPAVSVDSSGNLYVAYSASSSTQFAGVYGTICPASSDSCTAPTTVQAGTATYTAPSPGPNRWGDYSAAALDPTTGQVWVAGEYAPVVAGSGDWGTAAAELSLPSGFPAITSAAQTTFTEGSAGTFTVAGAGTPTFTETGAPSWVSLDPNTGALSGTPPAFSGGSYPIQITATNGVGSVTQSFTLAVNPAGPAYTPDGPVRVLDKAVGPNGTISLQVTGSNGVPSTGVTAVVMNVTVTGPTASSYVTVFPDGTARPNASNLNFTARETIPNLVVVPVSAAGKVDFYNHVGSVIVIADLAGYYSTGSGSLFHSAGPVRVLDTRNGIGVPKGALGAGRTIGLHLPGTAGLPESGVTAVVLNVTAVSPTASSYLTVFPEGPRPGTSSLNFTAGETIPNAVIVPVSTFGYVDFYNHVGSVSVIADLAGYYTAAGGASFTSLGPVRVLDTRNAIGHSGAVGPNGTISLQLPANDVPAGATAVVLNVTAVGPTASSYVTVYPDGTTRPSTSSLNFTAGETIPNLVVVPISAAGKVDFYNHVGTVSLVADLAGYYIN